jgi:N-acylneuraminate cytidylyltransferase
MKNIVAIIPARGGSKRLKNKNILPIGGKPMIAHTIQAALQSRLFDEVLVSTDSPMIAAVAQKLGASVPFLREARYADDHTPVSEATLSSLIQLEGHSNRKFETVVQLMPNCPCRTAADIRNAYAQFRATKAKFQISVFPFGWMNPWWAMMVDAKGQRSKPLFPAALKKRSQDLEKLYCPTGAVWIADAKALVAEHTFYGHGYRVFAMDWQAALDIDDIHDFRMAEAVFKMRTKKKT